jgi:hypothetical protein
MATGEALAATTTSQRWEYLVVPLDDAGGLMRQTAGLQSDRLNELDSLGWKLIGLQRGDLVTPPVALLRHPVG